MSLISKVLLLTHIFCTLWMTSIIWLIQIVQYPLFKFVDSNSFQRFHSGHTRKITWVVGPIILAECLSISILLFKIRFHDEVVPIGLDFSILLVWLSLSLGCLISTAILSVPCHDRLSQGWDLAAHEKLLKTNWIRTLLWTIHCFWIFDVMKVWI